MDIIPPVTDDREEILFDSVEEGDACSIDTSLQNSQRTKIQEQDSHKNKLLEIEYTSLKILLDLDEQLNCKRFSEILQKTCEQFFKTQNSILRRTIYRTIFSSLAFLIKVESQFIEVYKSSQDLFIQLKNVISDQFGEDLASEYIEEVYLIRTRQFYKQIPDLEIQKK